MSALLRKKGFTLMEMLIVVAVIAILIAIAIPVYSAHLRRTQEAVCQHNREILYREFFYERVLNSWTQVQARDYAEANLEQLCPSGGDYSISQDAENNIWVHCSEHPDDLVYYNPGPGFFETVTENGVRSFVDSTAGTGGYYTSRYLAYFKDIGIDLGDQGIRSWTIENRTGNPSNVDPVIFWSQVDVSTVEVGAIVPVMRYDPKTGLYTAGYAEVQLRQDQTYQVLIQSNNAFMTYDGQIADSSQTTETQRSFNQTMQYYLLAQKEYEEGTLGQ